MEAPRRLILALATACLVSCGSPDWRTAEESAGPPPPSIDVESERALARERFSPPREFDDAVDALEGYRGLIAADPKHVGDLVEGAEVATWIARREEGDTTARLGVEWSAAALRLAPDNARAHYARAVSLGLYAQSNKTEGLGLVKEMAAHARRVVALDPALDGAGGHRYLCRLLAQTPGMPASIGDVEAAITHGRKAVAAAPDHPGNHIALGDAYRRDDEPAAARRHALRALELLKDDTTWGDRSDDWRDEARRILHAD